MHDKAFLNRSRSKFLPLFFVIHKKVLDKGGGNVIIKHKQKGGMAVENKFKNLFTKGHDNNEEAQNEEVVMETSENEEIVIEPVDILEEPVVEVVDSEVQQEMVENVNQSQDNTIVKTDKYYGSDSQIPFTRVNFELPETIRKYGYDILKPLSDLMKKTTAMANIDEVNPVKFNNMINELGAFAEQDDDNTLTVHKALPEKGLLIHINKALNKINEKKAEIKASTETEQVEEYNKNIDNIATAVEKEKNNTLATMDLDSEIMKLMRPYLDTLKIAIDVGELDLKEYEDNVANPRKSEYEANPTDQLRKLVLLDTQRVRIFRIKLDDLRKRLSLLENNYTEIELRQGPNMELVIGYDSYLTTTVETLRLQAQSIVANKKQRQRQEMSERLNDKTNEVYKKNSEILLGNIQKSIDMSLKGSIYMETLVELNNNVKAGIDLLKSGNEKKMEAIERDKEMVSSILKSYDEYGEELQSILEANDIDTGSYISNNYKDKDEPKKGSSFFRFGRKR